MHRIEIHVESVKKYDTLTEHFPKQATSEMSQ